MKVLSRANYPGRLSWREWMLPSWESNGRRWVTKPSTLGIQWANFTTINTDPMRCLFPLWTAHKPGAGLLLWGQFHGLRQRSTVAPAKVLQERTGQCCGRPISDWFRHFRHDAPIQHWLGSGNHDGEHYLWTRANGLREMHQGLATGTELEETGVESTD